MPQLETRALAIAAAYAAAEKKAIEVLVLDLRGLTAISDYFVIASVGSQRQAKSVADEVQKSLQDLHEKPLRKEGESEGGWVLLDYAGLVIHVFGEEERGFYGLERLWCDAPVVDWESELATSS